MAKPKPPAIDPLSLEPRTGSAYPSAFSRVVEGRLKRALGNAFGLKNFGVNMTVLQPGAASALRHWHAKQDEFIYVVDGEVTLVTDAGAQVLRAGMVAGFPAGKPDGHCLINKSDRDVTVLEVGDRTPGDVARYPDEDLEARDIDGRWHFTHKDGKPYS